MSTMSRVYLKRTDARTQKVVITDHVAWDLDRFLASQQEEQSKLRKIGKDYSVITIATEAEYRAAHWPKKGVRHD
jgi:hypothetical protein